MKINDKSMTEKFSKKCGISSTLLFAYSHNRLYNKHVTR